jgi:hypothetical protein
MTHVADKSASVEPARVRGALDAGVARLAELQGADGSWRGDYGGPLFLSPMYVAAHYFAGREIPADVRGEMIRYLRNVQLPDGGVPLHADSDASTMFTSTLSYVALRLLGVASDDADVVRMREWIRRYGTPLGAASWGKWVLALLIFTTTAACCRCCPSCICSLTPCRSIRPASGATLGRSICRRRICTARKSRCPRTI